MELDVRGMACPQPVIRTKKAMGTGSSVTVLVSDIDQVQNVKRMAERSGWIVSYTAQGDHFCMTIEKGSAGGGVIVAPEDLVCRSSPASVPRTRVAVISSQIMGKSDPGLGKILMRGFLSTLKDLDHRPETLIFFNEGVKLLVDGSPVLAEVNDLATAGVEILACGTCLDYFNLKDKLAVGTVSNMFDIATAMLKDCQLVNIA